ncbi:MAG: TetR/AcrR family transcriptional regulator [Spirochaetaceae bacterium]|nr:TetR/AcrR family transcriptional regulator [Spirochaetaceae bacterium]
MNMQVLKDEVRQRIIKSARREFKKRGFEKASMRSIASSANMTVGNLYRYYKNKEDLYGAIIGNLFDEIKTLKSHMPEEPEARLNYLLEGFKELQKDHRSEWLTLFGGSVGTKYQKVADDLHGILRDTLKDVLKKNNRRPEIAVPVASAIIYGLNTILRSEKGKTDNLADDFLNYMMVDIANRVA